MLEIKKIIRVSKAPFLIFGPVPLLLSAQASYLYLTRRAGGSGVMAIICFLPILFLFSLAWTRIEVDEQFIRYINFWRRKQMRISDIQDAGVEFGITRNPFRVDGLIRFVIKGKDDSKIVINMKLFPRADIVWLTEFVNKSIEEHGFV